MKKDFAVLVAGGTGGHINAAIAIGEALVSEGWEIEYLSGKRPLDYKLFKNKNVRHLDSRPLRTNNPIQLLKNLVLNFLSFFAILSAFIKKRPKVIVGAGGYVCGPSLMAGFLLGIPVFIIEQNAVMGLTNKILGWISTRIFVHFTKTKGLSERLARKVKVVGNPTRKAIQPVSPKSFDGELKVLVLEEDVVIVKENKSCCCSVCGESLVDWVVNVEVSHVVVPLWVVGIKEHGVEWELWSNSFYYVQQVEHLLDGLVTLLSHTTMHW
jgi:UDP-N-acetylglucosamine:LPS N-acetylglucosamine transferase